ncbi:hypothetical protein [Vannielia litorea]|uniref:hypothetical protein n=1 Tax=Vannielia litorea TaxID=1217970 RepID=UPI001C985651|nr:hypothetical protein [Vannielia litorea]MBY6047348.1 hypothetical protein [Vannielia litorea]MBY6074762.1 hypothetical protein [Vannielia litorea]
MIRAAALCLFAAPALADTRASVDFTCTSSQRCEPGAGCSPVKRAVQLHLKGKAPDIFLTHNFMFSQDQPPARAIPVEAQSGPDRLTFVFSDGFPPVPLLTIHADGSFRADTALATTTPYLTGTCTGSAAGWHDLGALPAAPRRLA